jgi:hypothetical protein
LLNVALFGITAAAWRDANPSLEGNIRDHASIEQLVVFFLVEESLRKWVSFWGVKNGKNKGFVYQEI